MLCQKDVTPGAQLTMTPPKISAKLGRVSNDSLPRYSGGEYVRYDGDFYRYPGGIAMGALVGDDSVGERSSCCCDGAVWLSILYSGIKGA